MKRNSLLLAVLCFTVISVFAQKPILNESFENFNVNSNSSSGISWNALSTDIAVQVVENPNKSGINKSSKVLKIDRSENTSIVKAYEATYRGVTTISYDLSKANSSCIEVKVLKNVPGKLSMRIYADGINYKEVVSQDMQASDNWQTVKFDFTGKIETPFTASAKFLIQPEKNGNPASAQSAALTIYVDDIKMVDNTNPKTVTVQVENNKPLVEGAKNIDFNLWRAEDGNSGLITYEMIKNPIKDASISREKVLKITKNGGADAASWHNVSNKDFKTQLNKDKFIVEMKVLFPISENSVSTSDMGLRMGDSYKGEVIKRVAAMDKWQTIKYDYSTNSEFSALFKLNKDTTINKISFLPRRDKEQESNIVIYIGEVKLVSK